MRIGMFVAETSHRNPRTVADTIESARRAERLGLATAWVPHVPWSLDALTSLALIGQQTSRIELGTAVVPIWSRHPYAMAQQALTTQAASNGRLLLGIGPSHQVVAENWYGVPYEGVIGHMREYVDVLEACFAAQEAANTQDHGPGGYGGSIDYVGERFSTRALIDVPGSTSAPIYLAALAPMMLKLAGERSAGTITWMGDERTHAEHVVPLLERAARGADRPTPRVIAGLPIAVCDDQARAREVAETMFGVYRNIPAYSRMLERGEAQSPADVALVGTEAQLTHRIEAFGSAGVTDLCAFVFHVSDDTRVRTEAFLESLC